MFWKIALTAAVVLFISGRTGVVNNPLVRLLLPHAWSSRLGMLPMLRRRSAMARAAAADPAEPTPEPPAARSWLVRHLRVVLLALLAAALIAWYATRWLIQETPPGGPSP